MACQRQDNEAVAAAQLIAERGLEGLGDAVSMLINEAMRLERERHLAAWMGLTPRHTGSGHRMHLGGISKRGDRYLRMLLIHGARSVLIRAHMNARAGQPLNRLQQWAMDLRQRSNHNKATCALANKLARIAWAVWAHDRAFDGNYSSGLAA